MIVLVLYFIIFTAIAAGVGAVIKAVANKEWQNQSIWVAAAITGAVLTIGSLAAAANQYSQYAAY